MTMTRKTDFMSDFEGKNRFSGIGRIRSTFKTYIRNNKAQIVSAMISSGNPGEVHVNID